MWMWNAGGFSSAWRDCRTKDKCVFLIFYQLINEGSKEIILNIFIMKTNKIIVAFMLSFTAFLSVGQIPEAPFQPTWESLSNYRCPEWFRDAKFGIFIHWGVYSVPAFGSEWYPRWMYKDSLVWGTNYFQHHLKTYGPQDKFGYKDFIPMFRAEKFDASQWVDVFKKSGAKYILPVAEHHDGFAMYNTGF